MQNMLGCFDSIENIAHEFSDATTPEALIASQIKHVLYARYSGYGHYRSDYEMYARVLYIGSDDQLYEVHGGHCSYYGLEGQWKPAPATPQEVIADVKMGETYAEDSAVVMFHLARQFPGVFAA
jgi:hypothetical protein